MEARKFCQKRDAVLVALDTQDKAAQLAKFVRKSSRRHFNEFWTGGNDIEAEGEWEWAGRRGRVGEWGWADQARTSLEENCLVWVVEEVGVTRLEREGWHGASCCNMHRYLCQSPEQ